ncbi:Transposase [Raineyella antarctica]|uniref:Transposase n=1 Tax=Raineyella antarctica TaxID=1577474 RepID=A0A1G6H0W1_9ACTN|nr:IS110 family transposase [Raineyella antarctica]SDB79732.1 Transposase [Raineyella antarctica]SDB87783.1 Transposase [Raineyella antarctica]SDB90903.1 Transposase [Raineyella antarctica]
MTSLAEVVDFVIGVDTHVETHTAAVIDAHTGAALADLSVPTTPEGYRALIDFADEHGALRAWAIEGTGGHGAGLTRLLAAGEEYVVELDRPERTQRRHGAKSDKIDAVRAAREALARPVLGTPRAAGDRQALSVLLAARGSAVDAYTVTMRQLFSLTIAAPEVLRAKLRGHRPVEQVRIAAKLRIQPSWDTETSTTARVLRQLARRCQGLQTEAAGHETAILAIVKRWRPDLLDQLGVGPIVAAVVLCAWSHPGRIHSEAAFAMLAGVAPIPANSGQTTTRYRLNRHGDRQLNRALHTIVLSRQRYHQPTKDYTARRTAQGKTPREIKRCLKRYIARDLYRLLEHPPVLDRP